MEVIDAQIILHPREVLESVEMAAADRETAAVEMARVAMASVGVDKALWHGELTLCKQAFALYPDVFRGVVYFPDPEIPDVDGALAEVVDAPGLVGFRLTPAWPPTGEFIERLRGGVFDPWFAAAERLGLPACLFMSSYVPDVRPIAERFPELRIVVDHIGMPPSPHVPLRPDRLAQIPDLLALAEYENVAVKFTGVPAVSYEPFPFADLWPACHQIIDAFGLDRLFWGADFRRISPQLPYRDLVDFLRLTSEVSEDDKRKLFSESVRAYFGWDDAAHSAGAQR
jgi:L-fuconolactonase